MAIVVASQTLPRRRPSFESSLTCASRRRAGGSSPKFIHARILRADRMHTVVLRRLGCIVCYSSAFGHAFSYRLESREIKPSACDCGPPVRFVRRAYMQTFAHTSPPALAGVRRGNTGSCVRKSVKTMADCGVSVAKERACHDTREMSAACPLELRPQSAPVATFPVPIFC